MGGKEGGKFDVPGVDAQEGGVFAGASALHGGAHHHHGEGELDAVVDGGQQHGLGAAAACAGDRGALRIDLGQAQQEVQSADRVPGLEPHDALDVRLRLRTVEAPVPGRIHLGALLGEGVDDCGRKLDGVRVAQHVPLPDNATHPGELDAKGLEPAAPPVFKAFLAPGDFLADLVRGVVRKAGILPVAVRKKDAGYFALRVFGAVEVACDVEAGGAFKVGLFHNVIAPVDTTVDDGVEGRFGRHWPEALGDEDPAADLLPAGVPCGERLRRGEGEVAVQVFERGFAGVVGAGRRGNAAGDEGKEGKDTGCEGGAQAIHKAASVHEGGREG